MPFCIPPHSPDHKDRRAYADQRPDSTNPSRNANHHSIKEVLLPSSLTNRRSLFNGNQPLPLLSTSTTPSHPSIALMTSRTTTSKPTHAARRAPSLVLAPSASSSPPPPTYPNPNSTPSPRQSRTDKPIRNRTSTSNSPSFRGEETCPQQKPRIDTRGATDGEAKHKRGGTVWLWRFGWSLVSAQLFPGDADSIFEVEGMR